MAVRQYIGARYVPIFGRKGEDSIQWDNTGTYEPLTVVLYQGNSYTSRQFVPVGIEITNEDYWAETGNYNAQVEQYRQEVLGFDGRITQNASDIDTLEAQMAGTASSALLTAIQGNAGNIETLQGQMAGTSESGLKGLIDALETSTVEALEGLSGDLSDVSGNLAAEVLARQEQDGTMGAQIAALTDKTIGLVLGGTVMPSYVGSFEGDEQHASCLRMGNKIYTLSPNNWDGTGTARIWNLDTNTLQSSSTILMGHGNSVAYDPVRDCIWIAPMQTYVNGVGTDTNILYKYTTNLSSKVDVAAPERIYGVSFDPITSTLYAFNTLNGTNEIRVYTMGAEDSAFTLYRTITNEMFKDLGASQRIYWQDFAVYDGIGLFTKVDGTCYVINLNDSNANVTSTIRVSHNDAGGLWNYAELEGMEFDSSGRLYAIWQCPLGFTNSGANVHAQRAVGFVTQLNTAIQANAQDCSRLTLYGTIKLASANTFGVARSEAHSINELMYRSDESWNVIEVPEGMSFTFDKCRIQRSCCLRVMGTLVINDTIEIDDGNFFLFIRKGTLRFNTPSDGKCIDLSSRACIMQLRCIENGHLYNTNSADTIGCGYTPSLIAIGAMDNVTSITVNTNERTPGCLCMGSYLVWQTS